MSISLTIPDTHKAIRALEAKGLSAQIAVSIVETVQRASLTSDPATKGDLKVLRVEVRADVKASENRLIIWMISLQVAMAGSLIAAQLVG